MGLFGEIVEAATRQFNLALPKYGFPDNPIRHSDGAYRRWWIRDFDWKSDVVEIVYRRGGELRLHVNFILRMPKSIVTDPSYEFLDFAGFGISTRRIPQPIFFRNSRINRYAKHVLDNVLAHMEWFDLYGTPAKCLEKVSDIHRNGPMGGPYLTTIVNHLEKMV